MLYKSWQVLPVWRIEGIYLSFTLRSQNHMYYGNDARHTKAGAGYLCSSWGVLWRYLSQKAKEHYVNYRWFLLLLPDYIIYVLVSSLVMYIYLLIYNVHDDDFIDVSLIVSAGQ